MYPKRPSEVGLSSTRSRPRSSAPCGSIDTSAIGSAAAGPIPTTVAAVPSEAAAVPCRKRRRLMPRPSLSSISLPIPRLLSLPLVPRSRSTPPTCRRRGVRLANATPPDESPGLCLRVLYLDVAALDESGPVITGVVTTGEKDIERVSFNTWWRLTHVLHVDLEPARTLGLGNRRVLGPVLALEPGVPEAF